MDSELLLKFIGYFQTTFRHSIVAYAFMLFFFFFGQPLSKQLYN